MMKPDFSVIDAFVASGINRMGHRAYLNVDGFSALYLRIAHHRIDRSIGGQLSKTLDIASVSVFEEMQQKGLFKALLCYCEKLAVKTGLGVYVECIGNPDLEAYMAKLGYVSDNLEVSPSYGKTCEQLKAELENRGEDFSP